MSPKHPASTQFTARFFAPSADSQIDKDRYPHQQDLEGAQLAGSQDQMIAVGDDFAVLADARIDNRDELWTELGTKGQTDAELILTAWQRWGEQAVERLYGDFGFALFDRLNQRVFCVRDHIGSVPIWYAKDAGGGLIVSTRFSSVSDHPEVSQEVNLTGLAEFIQRGNLSARSQTLLTAVKRLPQATVLCLDKDEEVARQWWDPADFAQNPNLSDDELVSSLERLLVRAVEDRVGEASKIALHLSGGLDSASIALVAQRMLAAQGTSVDLGFAWQDPPDAGQPSPEHQRIEAISVATGIPPIYAAASAEDMKITFAQNAFHSPPAEMHWFEAPILRRCQEDGVDVILSGWGGDECVSFSGRSYFQDLLRRLRIRKLASHRSEGDLTRLQFFLSHALLPVLRDLRHWVWPKGLAEQNRSRKKQRTLLLSPRLRGHLPDAKKQPPPGGKAGVRAQLLNIGHLQRRIESWADYGAQFGIRYRYPLLDRRLVEFALTIPTDRVYKGHIRRWPMREVVKRLGGPSAVVYGDKLETERVNTSFAALRPAMVEIGRKILAADPPLPGTEWVDLGALRGAMEVIENTSADDASKEDAWGILRFYQKAFQVVDWSGDDSQSSAGGK